LQLVAASNHQIAVRQILLWLTSHLVIDAMLLSLSYKH
jgi:hypothetical protein